MPERRTHDYVRHGTSTLFAAPGVATATVTAGRKPRHRHQEFLAFLEQVAKAYPDDGDEHGQPTELHLVMDNYAAHEHVEVRAWLAKNPPDPGPLHPDLDIMDEALRAVTASRSLGGAAARRSPSGT